MSSTMKWSARSPSTSAPPTERAGSTYSRWRAATSTRLNDADFAAAAEGWLFDPADRKGVLHVKIAPQRATTGFALIVGL